MSSTTPTTVSQSFGPGLSDMLSRLPSASSSGQIFDATDALTTTTPGAASSSPAVKVRPLRSRIPMTRK